MKATSARGNNMSADINIINIVPIRRPDREIMSRLGYNRHRNVMFHGHATRIDGIIESGFALCRPRGCWARVGIVENDSMALRLDDGTVIESRALAALLCDSHALWLAAASVGPDISQASSQALAAGDGAAGAIYDAVGSESADAAMDWLQHYMASHLSRAGEKLTRKRFSPGYSDLALAVQRDIFRILRLEQFGLRLSESLIIEPEKSVTAFAGIEKTITL